MSFRQVIFSILLISKYSPYQIGFQTQISFVIPDILLSHTVVFTVPGDIAGLYILNRIF
jgi:hypothetical protein